MNTNSTQSTAKPASFSSIIIAWTVVLLVSDLPDAIWQALAGNSYMAILGKGWDSVRHDLVRLGMETAVFLTPIFYPIVNTFRRAKGIEQFGLDAKLCGAGRAGGSAPSNGAV